ncbi:MAG: polyketide synthase dehydratase domain-containing protein, partial [Bacillota bacterium]|nr:polyketide synthase dehydratase domain-containing protein [Bacillota bacterium]
MDNQNNLKFSLVVKNEDFVVRDHRLHQARIMPGVTFLDIIYRFLKMRGFNLREVELRRVLFKEPVVTTEEFDKKVEIIMERKVNYWSVAARSIRIKNGKIISDSFDENLEGECWLNSQVPLKKMDIGSLKQNAARTEDMDYVYSFLRTSGIHHYDYMKALGKLYVGKDYVLGELGLNAPSSQYIDYFQIHPAYLDSSTCVIAMVVLKQTGLDLSNAKPMIPIYIDSFRNVNKLGEKCYVYIPESKIVDPRSRGNSNPEIAYSDIEVYNEYGELAVLFNKFGSKRVRSENLITKLQKTERVTVDNVVFDNQNRVETSGKVKYDMISLKGVFQRDLRTIIAGVMGMESKDIDVEKDFFEIGMDSKALIMSVEELEKKMGNKLYPTLLF